MKSGPYSVTMSTRHKYCGRCLRCKEQRKSYMFGRMGFVIPDNIQTWITSQFLPYDSMETIAKVGIICCYMDIEH